jgi:hypothetical protein
MLAHPTIHWFRQDELRTPALLHESQPECCRKMRLASAGRPKEQGIGALIEPAVAAIAPMPRAVVSIGTISLYTSQRAGEGKSSLRPPSGRLPIWVLRPVKFRRL